MLNRGVDKRTIFLDDKDYFRFVHDLFEFNDANQVLNLNYAFGQSSMDVGRRYIRKPRKLLVDIMAFTLMPNHYHLLLTSKIENGVSLFMKKLNGGYAKYFNEKYERSGALFQGKYKAVRIAEEAHFIHIPYYIHLNPLDLKFHEWRERQIKNPKAAMDFLNKYRWSSHMDYAGIKNFPPVTNRTFLLNYFGSSNEYLKSLSGWLKDLDLEDNGLAPLLLESTMDVGRP